MRNSVVHSIPHWKNQALNLIKVNGFDCELIKKVGLTQVEMNHYIDIEVDKVDTKDIIKHTNPDKRYMVLNDCYSCLIDKGVIIDSELATMMTDNITLWIEKLKIEKCNEQIEKKHELKTGQNELFEIEQNEKKANWAIGSRNINVWYKEQWWPGTIIDIFNDVDNEWLRVQWDTDKTKQFIRNSNLIMVNEQIDNERYANDTQNEGYTADSSDNGIYLYIYIYIK